MCIFALGLRVSCSQTMKCFFSFDTCYMCTTYISIQSDCVFIVRTTRCTGTESVVNIINLLWKVIVHHVQRRLLGYEQTRSKLSLSPFCDPWSHPSSREPPERLEFSSALPFLFFRVYLLSPNSFPAPPSPPSRRQLILIIIRNSVHVQARARRALYKCYIWWDKLKSEQRWRDKWKRRTELLFWERLGIL